MKLCRGVGLRHMGGVRACRAGARWPYRSFVTGSFPRRDAGRCRRVAGTWRPGLVGVPAWLAVGVPFLIGVWIALQKAAALL